MTSIANSNALFNVLLAPTLRYESAVFLHAVRMTEQGVLQHR